jgi:hypothetical protein
MVLRVCGLADQWGHRVSLHLAGAASPAEVESLTTRAREAGIVNFRITGYLSDEEFRDYLLAVDLGLQLRISPLLGVSGPLSDLAAYGTTSIASNGLAVDVDTPIRRPTPDDVSGHGQSYRYRLSHPIDHDSAAGAPLRASSQRMSSCSTCSIGLLEAADGVGIDIEKPKCDPCRIGIRGPVTRLDWPSQEVQADFVVPMEAAVPASGAD